MAVERFPVEASHVLMFARAIGDENPVYTNPSSPEAAAFGNVIAPPTFTIAGAQFATLYFSYSADPKSRRSTRTSTRS